MIKNKDGTYNKFKLLIISLIFIITISITGVYILQNIKLPTIETPSWSQTISPTPTISPTLTINPTINPTPSPTPTSWSYPSNVTYGGSGGSSKYANVTYYVGGGGGAGYASVVNINSTTVPAPIITPQETSNPSQNVSQTLAQALNPLGESSWMIYLIFIIPMIMMMSMIRMNSFAMLVPAILGLIIFGYFFNIGSWSLLAILGIIPMVIIIFSMFSDR